MKLSYIDNYDFDLIQNNLDVLKQKKENNNLIIQYYDILGRWVDILDDFEFNIYKLRIKPESLYQPYTEVKEEWIGKKVQRLDKYNCGAIFVINGIAPDNVYTNTWNNLQNLFSTHIWGNNGDENDGLPFGEVKE